ncbi:MAG: LicD family protein [Bacteroidaceae bacterium]|nr:LicD family protein [Bacteroidaceae bacterium]MBR1521193.1 LicD family protein [Bacteroidaceae bacterium]
MATYDIRTLQLRILDILLAIDKVCREHGLRYYLAAGTMLGAMRHQGFIPWDDDVDIAMPRKDYDQLMQYGKQWMPQPYEVLCAENNLDYPSDFAKIIDASTTLIERAHHSYIGGIYVDVFPLDSITSDSLKQTIHLFRYSFWKKALYLLCRDPYKHGRGPSCWLPLLCRKIFTKHGILRQLLLLQKAYDKDETPLVIDHDFGRRGIMPRQIFGTPRNVTFEGHTLSGVEQVHPYLHQLYGDYMVIPPESQQRQHNFFYLDYNLPYKDYHDTRDFLHKRK